MCKKSLNDNIRFNVALSLGFKHVYIRLTVDVT